MQRQFWNKQLISAISAKASNYCRCRYPLQDGNLYSGMKKLRSARLHCSSSSWLELSLLHSHAVHMAVNAKTGAVVGPLLKAKDDAPSRPQPPVGQWVVAEAPARIDLAGGWTDTPPVCFERKGMVAGVAVTLDGKVATYTLDENRFN